MNASISLEGVNAAAALLSDIARVTPVHTSRAFSQLIGGTVLFKCENLQRAGSFKVRGAYVRMARLSQEERQRGVVAASAGNHAQGVALAAAQLGIPAVVYMPVDAALPKIAATREYGADVRLVGSTVEEALHAAQAEADRSGLVVVHPFDHRDVIEGQATVAAEILHQVPEVATVIAPLGGGGLVAGLAGFLSQAAPHVQVIGVQAAQAAAYPAALAAGRPIATVLAATMADGIAVGKPGEVPLDIIRRAAVSVVTVTEEEISRALLAVAERAKLLVEPAGAVGAAAIVSRHPLVQERAALGPTVVVLSGGNIDPLVLSRVVRHGLAAAGRYLQLRVLLNDRPGALAELLEVIAADGGSIMHIDHDRTDIGLAIGEAWVRLQIETKGTQHCQDIVSRLQRREFLVERN